MQNLKITSEKISVVLQGPLYGESIHTAIISIRKWLPEAEIILSTWGDEPQAEQAAVDILVCNKPLEPLLDHNGNKNFIASQILSTQKGLALATRPYVLKMRADHTLKGDEICLQAPPVSQNQYTLLKERIVVSSWFVRDSLKVPFLFHLSDLIQFGRREDMIDLWNSSLPKFDELRQKRLRGHFGLFGNYSGTTIFREVPEQTLTLRWLERHGFKITLPYPCATKKNWFILWENILAANFHIIDANQTQVTYPERFNHAFLGTKTVLTSNSFEKLTQNPGSLKRYSVVLLQKYILAWFNLRYWMASGNVILSNLTPNLAKYIRSKLRKKMGLEHPHRI